MVQIGQNDCLWLKNLIILFRVQTLQVILTMKKFFERFAKKIGKKTNQKGFRAEKVVKGKGNKLYLEGYDHSNLQIYTNTRKMMWFFVK